MANVGCCEKVSVSGGVKENVVAGNSNGGDLGEKYTSGSKLVNCEVCYLLCLC